MNLSIQNKKKARAKYLVSINMTRTTTSIDSKFQIKKSSRQIFSNYKYNYRITLVRAAPSKRGVLARDFHHFSF